MKLKKIQVIVFFSKRDNIQYQQKNQVTVIFTKRDTIQDQNQKKKKSQKLLFVFQNVTYMAKTKKTTNIHY